MLPLGRKRAPSPARKAALLAISAGITWGFVAAVIKVLASHLTQGPAAVFSNWSPYVLVVTGALGLFLATNAFQAGPLAASQPGLTIADPLVAILLGITVFGEHVDSGPRHLAGEAIAAVVLAASVVLLSRSPLIQEEPQPDQGSGAGVPARSPPEPGVPARSSPEPGDGVAAHSSPEPGDGVADGHSPATTEPPPAKSVLRSTSRRPSAPEGDH
jgi:hypothetical protein